MGTSDRRFELRSRTAGAHLALERAVGALTSIDAYARYATGLYAGRQPIEVVLQALTWPSLFGGWRPVLIAADLKRDLADLDLSIAPAKTAWELPADVSGLLGMLYVFEGSSLGARVVYKRAEALGLDERFGARHLSIQAGLTQNWRGFLDILEAADGYDGVRAAAMADATFGAMYEAMAMSSEVCV